MHGDGDQCGPDSNSRFSLKQFNTKILCHQFYSEAGRLKALKETFSKELKNNRYILRAQTAYFVESTTLSNKKGFEDVLSVKSTNILLWYFILVWQRKKTNNLFIVEVLQNFIWDGKFYLGRKNIPQGMIFLTYRLIQKINSSACCYTSK